MLQDASGQFVAMAAAPLYVYDFPRGDRGLSGNSWSQFCTEMWMSEYSGGELLCRDDEEA